MSFRTKVVAFGTILLLLAAVVFGFSSLLGQPKLPAAMRGTAPAENHVAGRFKLTPTPARTLPPPEQPQPLASTSAPSFPMDLNAASEHELEALPGIGPVLAERIVNYREEIGGFASVEQLLEVSGIGPKKLAAIKELVFVEQ